MVIENPDYNDLRITDKDYSIGGGVSMFNRDFDHGFHSRPSYYGRGPRNWCPRDEHIFETLCEALFRSPHIDASDMEVMVKDGIVKLSGIVPDSDSKWESEQLALGIVGVQQVINDVKIHRS